MTDRYCHEKDLEEALCRRIYAITDRQGYPRAAKDRQIDELGRIFRSGCGTLAALLGSMADFSLDRGYPLSFRGYAGNLLVAHLLGLAQNDPMELGLPWESAFTSKQALKPIALNAAPEMIEPLRQHLRALFSEANVVWDVPGLPPYRVAIVSGPYDPETPCLTLDLHPHSLMSQVGKAFRQPGRRIPRREEVLDPAFLSRTWREDLSEVPILQDLEALRDFAPDLAPEGFSDLVKLLGLRLVPETWGQVADAGAELKNIIATQEDVYDRCIEAGASHREALALMRRVNRYRRLQLTAEQRTLLDRAGLTETLEGIHFLYPRGQCAEYLIYALVLAWWRSG